MSAIRRGDRVVTGGGLIGTVAKVSGDEEVLVDLAEGVRVRVVRSTIASVLTRSEPAPAKGGKDADDKDRQRRGGRQSDKAKTGGKTPAADIGQCCIFRDGW